MFRFAENDKSLKTSGPGTLGFNMADCLKRDARSVICGISCF